MVQKHSVLSCHTKLHQSHLLQIKPQINKILHWYCYNLKNKCLPFLCLLLLLLLTQKLSSDDTSSNNSYKSKRVLPINIVCDEERHPMQNHILLLQIKFLPLISCFYHNAIIHSETTTYTLIKIIWIFPNNINNFYNGQMSFHYLWSCPHISALDTLLKRNQNAIKVTSKNTNDTTLICFCCQKEMVFPVISKISGWQWSFLWKKL